MLKDLRWTWTSSHSCVITCCDPRRNNDVPYIYIYIRRGQSFCEVFYGKFRKNVKKKKKEEEEKEERYICNCIHDQCYVSSRET